MGLNKTLEYAHMCMYWPDITDAIKGSISACKVCLASSDRQQREPYISDAQTKPQSHLVLDNFEFQGSHYIATKFCVVWSIPSTQKQQLRH